MLKVACLTGLLLGVVAFAQNSARPWQTMQSLTYAQVESLWKSPPPEYGPEPYYGLNGNLTIDQVRRDLDTMQQLGFTAVTVQAGYGMPFAYLSPGYFAFFRSFVAEAKKRDMRVWIVDDAGYPSGFAGGKFSSEKPALRMQALEVAKTIPIAAGASIHENLPSDIVSAAAVNQDGAAMPIALNKGVLHWTAPAGNWTVLLVSHQFRTSPTRSDTNPHRVKDTTQSLEDYLDPEATEQFLEFTHEQYKKYVGDEFGRTILGIRGDEPDYSISGLPWTSKFFDRFKEIKGYDVRPYVALLAQTPSKRNPRVTIQLTPEQLRIKADYYDIFSQMFAAGFFKPQGDWCGLNHLEYQVHLNHEEMQMDLVRSEGSFFRDMRFVQVPGIDAIWHQIWKDTISDYPRLASSASHVYGKPRAFTESFAAYRPIPDVEMARYILNEQFVRGVNLVEMMYFPATSSGPGPPPSYMAAPGFHDLLTYVRRTSYLMAVGRPDAALALLLPTSSMWLGSEVSDQAFVSTERLLSEHQIDFDIVSEEPLARDFKAGAGTFQSLSGNSYRTVILPAPLILSNEVLSRLKTFAEGGGKVLFFGGTPRFTYSHSIRDARPASPSDFSWARIATGSLSPTPTPPQYPPAEPPQPELVSPAIVAAVSSGIVEPTVRLSSPNTALRVMKRCWKAADLYFFFDEGASPIDQAATLFSHGRIAEIWDPQTGSVAPLQSRATKKNVTIHLKLQPYETQLIVIR